ncbi:hypothetical protein [Azospirillum argentinense]|uniref:hypothetical protein n=1 Tax=Azospirillum argentinense TaxID=2970906 RepID=UPI0032DE6417
MQTPDLCTALMGGIEELYRRGAHLLNDGDVDPKWLYAAVAMAHIGHSQQARYVQLAAAGLTAMQPESKAVFLAAYELPSAVMRTMTAGPVDWPPLMEEQAAPSFPLPPEAGEPPPDPVPEPDADPAPQTE